MAKLHNKKLLELYLKGLIAKKYTYVQAAATTNYTVNYLHVLKKRYVKYGRSVLVSKKIGKPSPARIKQTIREKIVKLYLNEYKGLNFRFFWECLKDYESLTISYGTLRTIMNEYNITSPNSRRLKKQKEVHRPRARRKNEGDLWQIDATPYDWFGTGNMFSLHGGIDDATGKVTALYMCENECLFGYMEILRLTAKKYGGTPREIYSDRASIFAHTPRQKANLTIEEQLLGLHEKHTQWQRIMEQIGSKQVLAWSPQAKGRIERLWLTLQGRLPYLFKRNHIKTIDDANAFLIDYVDEYNRQFAKEAASRFIFYHPINLAELDTYLCAKYPRQLRNGYVKFHDYKFLVMDYEGKDKIGQVCVSERGLLYEIDNNFYPLKLLFEPQYSDSNRYSTSQVLYNIIWRCIKKDGKKEDYEPIEKIS